MNFKQFLVVWICSISSMLGFLIGYEFGLIALVYAYTMAIFNACIIIKLYNDGCD